MKHVMIAFVFGVALVIGCSSNPSAASACNQFFNTYCQALVNCQLVSDTGSCESTLNPNCPTSGTDSCSQSQVNQCTKDISNESCDALDPNSLQLPGSCSGC